jgi:chromosome segregation ATPase
MGPIGLHDLSKASADAKEAARQKIADLETKLAAVIQDRDEAYRQIREGRSYVDSLLQQIGSLAIQCEEHATKSRQIRDWLKQQPWNIDA